MDLNVFIDQIRYLSSKFTPLRIYNVNLPFCFVLNFGNVHVVYVVYVVPGGGGGGYSLAL